MVFRERILELSKTRNVLVLSLLTDVPKVVTSTISRNVYTVTSPSRTEGVGFFLLVYLQLFVYEITTKSDV